MKKILLIGDSIRQGYDKYLKEALKDSAEVYFPTENCRFAQYVLRNFHEWKVALKLDDVDLVHWNVGLWDTLEIFEDGPLTDINVYCEYIERICKRIKLLFPNAKVIFATSTFVREERFTNPKYMNRKNENTYNYNFRAVEIVKKYGFIVNDLYALTETLDESYYSDMVHLYTEKGTKVMVKAVCDIVCKELDIENKADINKIVEACYKKIEAIGN